MTMTCFALGQISVLVLLVGVAYVLNKFKGLIK